LRLLYERSELRVVDRFEDRAHLLGVARTTCGSKGRAKVAVTFPKLRFQARSFGAGAEASSKSPATTWCNPLLFSLRAPPVIAVGSDAELKCLLGLSVVRETNLSATFDPQRPRLPTLRHPAKDDGCSTTEVLSTAWNRCARGSRLLRSSTGPPFTRVAVLNLHLSMENDPCEVERPRLFYRTLSPGFDCSKRCPSFEGVPRGTPIRWCSWISSRSSKSASCGSVVPVKIEKELVALDASL